jgi:hypothetical protein
MISEALTVSRRTFLRHVNQEDLRRLEHAMGYAKHPRQGLTMAGDWHVRYARSKLHGRRVYFFIYSAIEYVFCDL